MNSPAGAHAQAGRSLSSTNRKTRRVLRPSGLICRNISQHSPDACVLLTVKHRVAVTVKSLRRLFTHYGARRPTILLWFPSTPHSHLVITPPALQRSSASLKQARAKSSPSSLRQPQDGVIGGVGGNTGTAAATATTTSRAVRSIVRSTSSILHPI